MKPFVRTLLAGSIAVFGFAGPVLAGPTEDAEAGYAADQKGDFASAMKLYQSAAAGGSAYAMFNLGVMQFEGKGVDRSYVLAMKWYKQAADKGYALAQTAMGSMNEQGQGVKRNLAEAAKWYTLAANQNILQAQNQLGVIYMSGDGVPQDMAQAYYWFTIASKQDGGALGRAARAKSKLTPQQVADMDKKVAAFKPPKA